MARAKPKTPDPVEVMECCEGHASQVEGVEYVFRIGDRVPSDHAAYLANRAYFRRFGEANIGVSRHPEIRAGAPEPEPEPGGRVLMRVLAKKGRGAISYSDAHGNPRSAKAGAIVETSHRGAANLLKLGVAERV